MGTRGRRSGRVRGFSESWPGRTVGMCSCPVPGEQRVPSPHGSTPSSNAEISVLTGRAGRGWDAGTSKGTRCPGPAHGTPGERPTGAAWALALAPSAASERPVAGDRKPALPARGPSPARPWWRQRGFGRALSPAAATKNGKHPGAGAAHAHPRARRVRRPGRHGSFSCLLLFLWLVSWSSFLSSLLWSWALLAGSRDLSLAPLPECRTPSRLILCRAWARALSPQPWTWGCDSQSWAGCGQGPAVLPVTAQGP